MICRQLIINLISKVAWIDFDCYEKLSFQISNFERIPMLAENEFEY